MSSLSRLGFYMARYGAGLVHTVSTTVNSHVHGRALARNI